MYKPLSVLKPWVRASCSGLRVPYSAVPILQISYAASRELQMVLEASSAPLQPQRALLSVKNSHVSGQNHTTQLNPIRVSKSILYHLKNHLVPYWLQMLEINNFMLLLSSHLFFLLTIMSIVWRSRRSRARISASVTFLQNKNPQLGLLPHFRGDVHVPQDKEKQQWKWF